MHNKKFKQVLAMMLAVLMVLALAACAKTPASSTAPASSAAGTESKVEEESYYNKEGLPICNKEITLTGVSRSDTTKDWNSTWFFKWVRENMGINLDFQVFPEESLKQKYAMLLTNDELPDITGFAPLGSEEIEDGYVMCFDKYMEEGLMPNLTKFFEIHPDAKAMATYNGKIYKLGNVRTDDISCLVRFQSINTRWLKNVGKEMPVTVDDLYEVLKAFRDQDANGNGDPNDEIPMSYTLGTTRNGERGDWNMLGSFGIDATYMEYILQAKNDKVYLAETTENYKAYLKYLSKLMKEGLLDSTLYSQSADDFNEKLKKDRVGVTGHWGGLGSYCIDPTDEAKEKVAQELAFTPAFKSEFNDDTNVILWNAANAGDCFASAKTKYPEAIARFVDYWYTEEGAILYNYGKEGETFDWVEGKSGLKTPKFDAYYEKYGYANDKPAYSTQWLKPANFVTWYQYSAVNAQIAAVKDEAKLTEYKKYSETAQAAICQEGLVKYGTAKAYPNVSYTAEQSDALKEKKTAIQSLISTYKCQFITGVKDVDAEWDAFQNELKKAGLDDVMKVEQEAYNTYIGK